jgi:hypothetical protein
MRFKGFSSPRYTPCPDELFDILLPDLGNAELKVLLYIIRRTFGFKKDRDPISFSQFLTGITTNDGTVLDRGCGVKDRTSLSKALQSLEEKGIIVSEKSVKNNGGNEVTTYSLHFEGVVGQPYQGSMDTLPELVGEPYPQETVKQETVKQETDEDPSKIRKASSLHKQEYDESRLTLVEYIADLSTEFIDTASIASSTTRAVNLFRRSGLSMDEFIDIMTEARAVTKERMASIKKRNREGDKTKMAYFFSILEDRLGLRTA